MLRKSLVLSSLLTILLLSLQLMSPGMAADPALDKMKLNISDDFELVNEKDDLHFKIDLTHMQNGDVQYAMSFTEARDFDDQAFLAVDRYGLNEKDERAIYVATKMAYIVENKSPDFFNDEIFYSPHFVKNTFEDTDAEWSSDGKTFKVTRYINLGPINLGKVTSDFTVENLLIKDMNSVSPANSDFVHKVLDFDAELGQPEKIVAFRMSNADKYSNGIYVLNKYFRVNKKHTLIVSYQVSSVRKVPVPFFIAKGQASKSALSEGRLYVKALRAYEIPRD